MWDCEHCGCRAIAASLGFCPMCFTERTDMPKITRDGGPTNQWAEDDPTIDVQPDQPEQPEQPEQPVVDPPAPDPAPELKPAPGPEPAPVLEG